MSREREIIDEDLCADCAHSCLLRPKRGYDAQRSPTTRPPWSAPALCVRGWPFKAIFMNIISECTSFERCTEGATNA